MNEIKQSVAEGMLLDALKTKNIGDKVYELAREIVDECIEDVESHGLIVPDDGGEYEDYEAWYDNSRDGMVETVYEAIQEYLNNKL